LSQTWTLFGRAWRLLKKAGIIGLQLLLIVLIAGFFYKYFHQIVIKPINVPSTLSNDGLTDIAAADELRQRLYEVTQGAYFNVVTPSYGGATESEPSLAVSPKDFPSLPIGLQNEAPLEINVPGTGTTLGSILDLVANLFPFPRTVISGGFTSDANQMQLTVALNGQTVYQHAAIKPSLRDSDTMIRGAAVAVMRVLNPDIVALNLERQHRPYEADSLMYAVINRGNATTTELAKAHLLRAVFLLDGMQPRAACDEIATSFKIDPNSYILHRYLSAVLLADDRSDQAVKEATEAVILSAGRSSADYYALGTSLFARQRLNEAATAYEKAIKLSYNDARAHDALGRTFWQQNRFADALSEFDVAATVDPGFAGAFYDRGALLFDQRRSIDASASFREALRVDPYLPESYIGLGYVAYDHRDYGQALREFRTALQIDHTNRDAYRAIETTLAVQGDRKARAELTILESARICSVTTAPAYSSLRNFLNGECAMQEARSIFARGRDCGAALAYAPPLVSYVRFDLHTLIEAIGWRRIVLVLLIAAMAFGIGITWFRFLRLQGRSTD
jgi:tetratricopeptide (TPR) repeat protein